MAQISSIKWLTRTLIIIGIGLPCISLANNIHVIPEAASGWTKLNHSVSNQHMVVTANRYASDAAITILDAGGTAMDAAIAAQMMLGLVEPQSSGIGGGAFLVYWDHANQQLVSYDGRETAPQQVNPQHFLDANQQPMSFFNAVIGGHSVGTPGLVHMLARAHQTHGKLLWPLLFNSSILQAQHGFGISPRLHTLLQKLPYKHDIPDAMRALYFTPHGEPRPIGYRLTNPAYATTLQRIAWLGSAVFYHGDIADDIVQAVKNATMAGSLSTQDLAHYQSYIRAPLCEPLGAYLLCGAPPPSSGAFTVISLLKTLLLSNPPTNLDPTSPAFFHRFVEASKCAFADRNHTVADPAFVDAPIRQQLSHRYLKQRAQELPLVTASNQPCDEGMPTLAFQPSQSIEKPSTTHLSIIDQYGNIASMTSSIEMAFGSRLMAGGFLLNNQLTDFSFSPQRDNGRTVANRIQANKRPRSSMAPMIIFNQRWEPVLVIGSPGGSRIINYVAKVLAQHLYLGADLAQTVHGIHVTNLNGQIEVEQDHKHTAWIVNGLQALGHKPLVRSQTSGLHVIQIKANNTYLGIADPRREGVALSQRSMWHPPLK